MKYLYLILQMNWYETLFIFIKIWAMFNCKNFLCNSFHFHLSFVDACKVKTIINSVLKLFCYCKNVSLYWFIFCTSLAYLCCIWLLPIMKKERRRKHQLLFFFSKNGFISWKALCSSCKWQNDHSISKIWHNLTIYMCISQNRSCTL